MAEGDPLSISHALPECTLLVKDEGGVYIRCNNESCPAKLRQSLRYFASRDAMDIDGVGEKIVDQLVDAELVKDFADLYRLTKEQLLTLDKFGERKADKLLEGVRASKDRGLARIGRRLDTPRRIACRLSTGSGISRHRSLTEASREELAAVDEIGDIIAESVHGYLTSHYGRNVFDNLRDVGVRLEETVTPSQDVDQSNRPLDGKTLRRHRHPE